MFLYSSNATTVLSRGVCLAGKTGGYTLLGVVGHLVTGSVSSGVGNRSLPHSPAFPERPRQHIWSQRHAGAAGRRQERQTPDGWVREAEGNSAILFCKTVYNEANILLTSCIF